MRKSGLQLALERARKDPDRMAAIHKAGSERHGQLWLRANIVAVNAANAAGLNAEEFKVPISSIVLRVLDTTMTQKQREALKEKT